MLLVVHVLQRPRPLKSTEEAFWPARGPTNYRPLEFRRDGKRVFEKRRVFYESGGLKQKKTFKSRRVFARTGSVQNPAEFLPKATVRNNSPAPLSECRSAKGVREAGVCVCWVRAVRVLGSGCVCVLAVCVLGSGRGSEVLAC